jgi:hypothetical protein
MSIYTISNQRLYLYSEKCLSSTQHYLFIYAKVISILKKNIIKYTKLFIYILKGYIYTQKNV